MSSPSATSAPHDISSLARALVTFTVAIGAIATILTATIMNVAVPNVMGAFGIGQDKAQWIGTGFLAATTTAMLLTDWLARRFGSRWTYAGALTLFLAGSLVGGFAENFDVLVLGRVLQGAAAGVVQPLAMLTMFQIFPPNERGKAMGIFGLAVILAPAVGPYLGGLAVDAIGWRFVFFLPIPFAALSILLSLVFLNPRDQNAEIPRFDWLGLALLVTFLMSLLIALSNGVADGWHSDKIVGLFAVAIAAFSIFIYWEIVTPFPILKMRLFLFPRFTAAFVVSFFLGAILFGSLYLIPLFVQIVQGYTATRSGLLQIPAGLAMAVIFPLVGRLADFGRENYMTVAGLLLSAISSYWMISAHTDTPFWLFAWWMVISRIGLALIFPPLSSASLVVLPSELVGQGSGSMNFSRTLGGAFGVNLAAIYAETRAAVYRADLTSHQHDAHSTTMDMIERLREIWANLGFVESFQEPLSFLFIGRAIVRQAEMLAFRDGFLMLAVISLAAVPPAFFIGMPKRRS